ncbi:phage tail tip lysozyme, partial [Novosphingobium sp. AAP93]|uniref:phage tail tip lysozyme n=1 Tax=Novosphingobium sp. AAP93 TaxID=1523427 RepID=UPI000A5ACE41
GDNIMAALPDVIANTIGNLVAEGVQRITEPESVPSLSLLKKLGLTVDDLEGGQKALIIQASIDPKSEKNYAVVFDKIKALFNDSAAVKKLTGWYVPSELSKSQDILAVQKVLEARQRKGIAISDDEIGSAKFVTGVAKAGLQYVTFQRFNYAYDTLKQSLTQHGADKPDAVAAGIVANLWVESGHTMDPSVPQMGGGGGEGVAQWTTSARKNRFAEVEGVAVLSSSLTQQLDFLVREMTDKHLYENPVYDRTLYNAGQKIMSATSASSAAVEFVTRFERPRDTAGQRPIRAGIANTIFEYESGRTQGFDDFKKIILGLSVA